jgi:hypothetical protein
MYKLADENINCSPFDEVHGKWLQLYTDSMILRALFGLVTRYGDGPIRETWERLVELLDKAIIVAGGGGDRRMDWIQSIISAIQVHGLPRVPFEEYRSTKRRKTEVSHTLTWSATPIPELHPPSMSEYTSKHYQRPFILRRYLDSVTSPAPPWPAVSRWKSIEYLLDQVGEGRVVPVEVGRAYDEPGWGQEIIPFRDFLRRVTTSEGHARPLYLAQHQLFRQFPQLEKDMALPDYVWSEPSAANGNESYCGPQTETGVLVNVWVGGGGEVISPAHTVSHALAVLMIGPVLQLLCANSGPEEGLARTSGMCTSHVRL